MQADTCWNMGYDGLRKLIDYSIKSAELSARQKSKASDVSWSSLPSSEFDSSCNSAAHQMYIVSNLIRTY